MSSSTFGGANAKSCNTFSENDSHLANSERSKLHEENSNCTSSCRHVSLPTENDDDSNLLLLKEKSSTPSKKNSSGNKEEIIHILYLALPVQIMMISQLLITTEVVIFAGHMSRDTLAGCSLANLFISVFGILTGQGISTACDTLFSRAVGKSKKQNLMVYFHQGWQIMFFTFLIMLCVIPVLDRFLFACGYPAQVLFVAGEYLLVYSPAVLIDYFFILLSRYLQCQDYVRIPALAAIAGNLIHIILQIIVSQCDSLGHKAVAASQALSITSMFVLEYAYVHVKGLLSFRKDEILYAFGTSWYSFLRLAVPGFLVIVLENLCFRIASMMTAFVGVKELDAQTVVNQIETLLYTVPASLGISVSIRVARSLGAGDYLMSQKSYKLGMLIGTSFALTIIVILGALGEKLPGIFTTDKDVIELAKTSIYVLLPMQLVDSFSAVLCGVLRGCARHRIAAILIFIGFYVISLPIGALLEYGAKLKMRGIWMGMILGLTFLSISYFYLVYTTNWQEQCTLASEIEGMSRSSVTNSSNEHLEDDSASTGVRRLSIASISSAIISLTPEVVELGKKKVLALVFLLALLIVSIVIRCFTELPIVTNNMSNSSNYTNHTGLQVITM